MNNLIEKLNWRYAAKRMNGTTIPEEKLHTILEAIKLAPSSMGLQPYTVVVIDSQEMKEKIHQKANVQPQILESSHVLVFAAWKTITAQNVSDYINLIASTRDLSVESLRDFENKINGGILSRPEDVNFDWAARQAYIALGHALVAAATEDIDATPMEGFNADLMDELLGLKEKGLRSVVMLTLGFRDHENDVLAKAKKVRRDNDQLFITI